MVYSGWDYGKRRFDVVPAGYMASTRLHDIVSGKLVTNNVTDTVQAGLGMILVDFGGTANIRRYRLPNASTDTANFLGVLVFDASNYRTPLQPLRSHTSEDMTNVVRMGDIRVITASAIPANSKVYCIYSESGAEKVGMFKATAGANSFEVKNAKWGEVTTAAGVATLELLSAPNQA